MCQNKQRPILPFEHQANEDVFKGSGKLEVFLVQHYKNAEV